MIVIEAWETNKKGNNYQKEQNQTNKKLQSLMPNHPTNDGDTTTQEYR